MSFCCSYEDDLIDPEKWDRLYKKMPAKCKKTVNDLKKYPDCVGIGKNKELGWFIMGSGQGPCLLWSEKHKSLLK